MLYLTGMRVMMFQLFGSYCKGPSKLFLGSGGAVCVLGQLWGYPRVVNRRGGIMAFIKAY